MHVMTCTLSLAVSRKPHVTTCTLSLAVSRKLHVMTCISVCCVCMQAGAETGLGTGIAVR